MIKILIVEDDPKISKMLEILLKEITMKLNLHFLAQNTSIIRERIN